MSQSVPDAGVGSAWTMLAFAHAGLAVFMLAISILWRADWIKLVPAGVSTGQVALLATWLILGVAKLKTRFVLYCVMGLLAIALGGNVIELGWVVLIASPVSLGFMAIAVSLPLYIAWGQGWRLTSTLAKPMDDKRWQVSIWAILLLTLLVAVLLALRQYVTSLGEATPDGRIGFPIDGFAIAAPIMFGVTLLGFGASAYSSVWLSLSNHGYYSHLLATLLIMSLLVVFPMHVIFGSPAHIEWAVVIGCAMLTLILSMLFLRCRGVRYVFLPYS